MNYLFQSLRQIPLKDCIPSILNQSRKYGGAPIILLFALLSCTLASAQSYVQLTNASGVTISPNEKTDLEAATQAIINILPAEDRPIFKVYDAGFYLHTESTLGGVPEGWAQVLTEVENGPASGFYLVIGRESNNARLNYKAKVKLKLPNTQAYNCLNQEERKNLEKYVEQTVNNNLHLGFAKAELEALSIFKKYLYKVLVCNCTGTGPACKFQNLDLQLLALGFRKKQIELGGASAWASGNQAIFDYAGKQVVIDGTEYDIAEQVAEGKTIIEGALHGNVYILDNESFANGEWENAQAQSSVLDYTEFWVMLTNDSGDTFLYSRFTLGGLLAATRPGDGAENAAVATISPWGLALKALGNAALDAVLQAVIIRIVDEKVSLITKSVPPVCTKSVPLGKSKLVNVVELG